MEPPRHAARPIPADCYQYAYCHNDPVNTVDVLGLATISVTGGSVDILGGGALGSTRVWDPAVVTAAIAAIGAVENTQSLRYEVVEAILDALAGDGSRPGDRAANDVAGVVDMALAHSGVNETDWLHPYSRDALLLRYSQLRASRVNDFMAGYHARRAGEQSVFSRLNWVGQICLHMPGSLEYAGREVLGINMFTRGVTGAELAPGWAGWGEVGVEGRLLAGAECALMFLPIRGGGSLEGVARAEARISSRGTAWAAGASDEAAIAASRLGNRYLARGHDVSSVFENGMGIVMRHDTGKLTVLGHESDFLLLNMNDFAARLRPWQPSSITLCVCRAADSPAASTLADLLGVPVLANRFPLESNPYRLSNGLVGIKSFQFEEYRWGWQIIRPKSQ
jgi:hypothetical protein